MIQRRRDPLRRLVRFSGSVDRACSESGPQKEGFRHDPWVFGAKRIPSLARSLGGGIREFRKGASGQYEEVEQKEKRPAEGVKAGYEAEGDVLADQKS